MLFISSLSSLKIFKFLSGLFSHVGKNALIKRFKISKFMMQQPGKQTITIHHGTMIRAGITCKKIIL